MGVFHRHWKGNLVQIKGILNKEGYKKILEEHAIPFGLSLISSGLIIQQDNDLQYLSKLCWGYLQRKESENIFKNKMACSVTGPPCNQGALGRARITLQLHKKNLWELLKSCWENIHLISRTILNSLKECHKWPLAWKRKIFIITFVLFYIVFYIVLIYCMYFYNIKVKFGHQFINLFIFLNIFKIYWI